MTDPPMSEIAFMAHLYGKEYGVFRKPPYRKIWGTSLEIAHL